MDQLPINYTLRWGQMAKVCAIDYKGSLVVVVDFGRNPNEVRVIDDYTYKKIEDEIQEVIEYVKKNRIF